MIRYTKMRQEHVTQVATIERACFSDPWSEKSISSELENPLSLWIVALADEAVIGYVGSQSVLGEADMMNIAVCEEWRRKGAAQGLVSALIEVLKRNDVHMLTLEVRVSNEPAKALYGKMGFVAVGRRPNYYRNPKEDALILRKEWNL